MGGECIAARVMGRQVIESLRGCYACIVFGRARSAHAGRASTAQALRQVLQRKVSRLSFIVRGNGGFEFDIRHNGFGVHEYLKLGTTANPFNRSLKAVFHGGFPGGLRTT